MIVLAGIDTFHIGYYLKVFNLTDEDWNALESSKEEAKAPIFQSSGSPISFKGLNFIMRAAGKRPYSYVLTCEDFTLKIAKRISNDHFPEVFIEFRSSFLWRLGYKSCFNEIFKWISTWAVISKNIVSRADLAIDIVASPDNINIENMVSHARKKHEHLKYIPIQDGSGYYYGSLRTGWTIGSGDLLLRIYSKTKEITQSRKTWFYDLWKVNGWDSESEVTRVEMQMKRGFLHDFNIADLKSFNDTLGDIFRYVTHEWFTLREPSNDINRSRWAVTQLWSEVQNSLEHFGATYGQLRGRIKESRVEALIPQATGLITSILALSDSNVIGDFNSKVHSHLKKKGLRLEDVIAEKRKKVNMFEDFHESFK